MAGVVDVNRLFGICECHDVKIAYRR